MTDLVLTLIGQDRPGLVEAVAAIVRGHGGNWLESRMTRLGGKFAGILRAELPSERAEGALRALADLETLGLKVMVEVEAPRPIRTPPPGALMELEVVGVDRPGIVQEFAQLLSAARVNVEEMTTGRRSAPMSGEMLFEARAVVRLPASTDVATLRAKLERAAKDLVVDVRLEPSS
ncbi:MAG TPA: ACT domain-containing protein [Polyangiaceae bacterium]|nr:ACT domain-containing protein [Polyangiaceae bacterium]